MLRILTAATIVFCLSLVAGAQETTRLEEEVLVTATRIPKPASRTGQSASVVTVEEMWMRQVHNAAEAIRSVPGVSISRGGPPGSATSIFLRGAASNQTVVLVDGVKVNDPTIGGQFNFYDLRADNAQSIEVLRGSASTLHGSEAIGGVVSIVTRQGESPLGARAFLEAGLVRYAHSSVSAWYGDPSLELSGEISGMKWDNQEDDNAYAGNSFAGRISTASPTGVHLILVGRYWDSTAEDPFDFPDFAVDPDRLLVDGNITRKRTSWLGKIELMQEPKEGVGFSVFASRFEVVSDFENGPDAQGDPAELMSDSEARVETYAASVSLLDVAQAKDGGAVTLVLGGEYRSERSDSESETPLGFTNVEGTTRNKAAFAHLETALGENLTVGGGYRHDDNSVFGKSGTWSATALLSFPESGTRFRGNFGEGIRGPTPVEFADPFVGNVDLTEERSTSYDVGVEQEFMEGDVVVAATWFRLDTSDLIAFDPMSGPIDPGTGLPTGRLENFTRTRTMGWELLGRARLFEELTISGFWTFQDPKNRSAAPGEDDRLPGRPKWFGGGTVEFQTGGFMAAVDLYTSGDYPSTGKIDPDGDPRDHPGRKLLVTVRAALGFGGGGMVFARVENIFDDVYYDSESGPEGLGSTFVGGVSWTF